MKKGVKILLIVLASVLGAGVLTAGGFMAYKTMGTAKVINLNDYMQVEFEGKDGKGKASMEYDTEAMKADYPRVDVDGLLHNCVDGEFDSAKNLSNGDKITWEWECDDDKAGDCDKDSEEDTVKKNDADDSSSESEASDDE